ncbi:MAG: GAF domain-containing protein [Acidimicrobiales bacterium]
MSEDRVGSDQLAKLLDAILTIGSVLDLPAMLHRIIQSATELAGAAYGALGVLDEARTGLTQFITVGVDDETHRSIGALPDGHGILGLLILDAKPLRLPDLNKHPDSFGFPPHHPPMTTFLGVPIRVRDEVFGNLYLTDKIGGGQFTDVDEELMIGLAAAAGVAIENARLHTRLHEIGVLEDRERIARDLHDTVIQRLFATGLSLQGTVNLVRTDAEAAVVRVEAAVDELDLTVKHIRSAIFGLEASRPSTAGTRAQIVGLAREAARALGFEPNVYFEGPVDSAQGDRGAAALVATVREALSNVARHAKARRVDVAVIAGSDVRLTITDDGVGPPDGEAAVGNGLRNMASRAEELGGTMRLRPADDGQPGTVLEWCVPRT